MSNENADRDAKSSVQNGIVQFQNTIKNLSTAPNGDHALREMCERWAVQSINGELQLTREEMIETLLAAALAIGRRLGKMQQDAQKHIGAAWSNVDSVSMRVHAGREWQ